MGKKDKGTKPLSVKQQRKESAAYRQGSGGSEFAAKRARRERDANEAARSAANKGGYSLGARDSLSSSYAGAGRPLYPFPGEQTPIEDYVKKVAAEKAARGQGRKPREQRPEPPVYNHARTNFSFITPASSGVEHDAIELAGHEFPAVAIATDTGHTYFHVSNTNEGWEIERHFTGGHRHRQPVTVTLKPDSIDKEDMRAQLENWAREQKAKGASLSFYHMSSHPMAQMVNWKTSKPAPAPHRSERAKEWGRVAEAANTEKPQEQILFFTPAFARAQYGRITILGRDLDAEWSAQEHVRTYLMVVKVAPRFGLAATWEIRRCLDTDSVFDEAKIRFPQHEITEQQMRDALSAWVLEQRNRGSFETTRHSRKYPQATMIAGDSDKAAPRGDVQTWNSDGKPHGKALFMTPSYWNLEDKDFTLFGQKIPPIPYPFYPIATFFAVVQGDQGWELHRCLETGLSTRSQAVGIPAVLANDETVVSELAAWNREYGNEMVHWGHIHDNPGVQVVEADSDGFNAPFLKPKKERVDPNELIYR